MGHLNIYIHVCGFSYVPEEGIFDESVNLFKSPFMSRDNCTERSLSSTAVVSGGVS